MFDFLVGVVIIMIVAYIIRKQLDKNSHKRSETVSAYALKTIDKQNEVIVTLSTTLIQTQTLLSDVQKQIATFEDMWEDEEESEQEEPVKVLSEGKMDDTSVVLFKKLLHVHELLGDHIGKDHPVTKTVQKIIDEEQA